MEWGSFLPDGEHFLFTHPLGTVPTLQIGSIRSDATAALVPSDSRAVYASPGYVLYVRDGRRRILDLQGGHAGLPARLFPIDKRAYRSFDVTPDGQCFLLNLAEPGGLTPSDQVVVDWVRLLQK